MGGDPSDSDSCIRYGSWASYGDVDDHFHNLDRKDKRYKFVCVDTDKNDCLDLAELTTLLDVKLGGAGEAKIEGLALATDQELSSNGYTEQDRLCAGHFLVYDQNGDRKIQFKEGKTWFIAHAATIQGEVDGATTTLDTAGKETKYFREHFWKDALGDRYDSSVKGLAITFDEFCAHWSSITLKEDSSIDLSTFQPPAPPAWEPEGKFLTRPPLLYTADDQGEYDFTDETRPSVYEVNVWGHTTLKAWYEWANFHENGICKTYV